MDGEQARSRRQCDARVAATATWVWGRQCRRHAKVLAEVRGTAFLLYLCSHHLDSHSRAGNIVGYYRMEQADA